MRAIARLIFQFRWWVIIVWLLAAAGLALFVPRGDTTLGEATDLLPSNTPVHRALDELSKHFGEKSGLSSAVIVFQRLDSPLTTEDLANIELYARNIRVLQTGESFGEELKTISVRTPAAFSLAGRGNPLISQDGQAAVVWVSLPFNYITKSAARIVKHLQENLEKHQLPAGITAAVTGSAGYGYDYAVATERSHDKTTLVTLVSVIVILLLVYRAPIAAVIPLAGISLAAVVTFKMLAMCEGYGLHSGTAERIFTFVLLYGAGVDYSLLFMSRYREFLDEGKASTDAVALALAASLPAIISSAAITISGLVMFCFARFSVYRDSGPAVVLAVAVAASAASTLVPALVAVIGPLTFWPSLDSARRRHPIAWPAIARFVTARPRTVMISMLIVLGLPAIKGAGIRWNYDALLSLKPTYPARRGTEIVERHWPTGETAPLTVLAVSDHPQTDVLWIAASDKMLAALRAVPDVDNVRAFSLPLGFHTPLAQNAAVLALARNKVRGEFVSADGQAMQMSAVLKISPLTREAMSDADKIAAGATQAYPAGTIYLTGATAEMNDLREITQRDFRNIVIMALIAILAVVYAVLGDFPVAVFILSATALSYLATLGLTCWVFQLLGSHGLEWKVQMLLFIVLIAVGQDYSIFFAVRLAQEARTLPCKQATQKALIFTGPVISSCGLIMAATLGSVMAGDVQLLVQLGFAFALGMLLDTFVVRPLLLPSLIILTGRTLQHAAVGMHTRPPVASV